MSLVIHQLKNLRTDTERLLAWERATYETVETCHSEDQAHSPHHSFNLPVKAVEPPLRPSFLRLFHERLPQELRDLVYAHILGFKRGSTWTIQQNGLYFRFDPRIAPRFPTRIIPPSLDETSRDPIFQTVREELFAYFVSNNNILLRYRYDSTTLGILTKPLCKHATGGRTSRPNQYSIKRLQILICPPESPEDDMFCDEDAEFEWHHMFPEPKNARSLAHRRQLETDLGEIRMHISSLKNCDAEFTFMISEDEWKASLGKNGMDEWLYSIDGPGRMRLVQSDWEKVIT
jgi:hypothetical protein